MKLSDIVKLFKDQLNVNEFKSLIENEIKEYESKHSKKGSSISISLNEDCEFYFDNKHLANLCQLYINESLTKFEVSYISDALLLSSQVTFQEELTEDVLETFCILDENKGLSTDEIINIMKELDSDY